MEKTKIALSKLFYWCAIHPVVWVAYKLRLCEPRNRADKILHDELAAANEEDKKAVELEMLAKIESLPPHLRAEFRELHISGLQFFLATHAIELLIRRNFQFHNLQSGIGALLGPDGTIGFEDKQKFPYTVCWECEIKIPANVTVGEISHVARVSEKSAEYIILFIVESLSYCPALIPDFQAITDALSGIILLAAEEEK
jgi:hypothetical protein